MYILGINAYHGDSSAAIFKNGELIAATEEERFRRIKHWAGFPTLAIKFCLQEAGITIEQLDHIAVSRDPKANIFKKAMFTLKNRVDISAVLNRLKNSQKVAGIKEVLAKELNVDLSLINAQLHNVEHHRSHLASAFFASSYNESAILSIDGFGDFTSTMTAIGKANKIEVLDTVIYPHSIGIFYTAFTQYLGFPHYGDEYKVMGLAPYGEAKYVDKLKDVIRLLPNGLFELNTDYFTHHKNGVNMSWEGGSPTIEAVFSKKMEDEFGPSRKKEEELTQYHKDIAASVQRITEEVIFHILNNLQKKTGLSNICIAGGVAQNSVANGKILKNTGFKNIYIPSAGHDAGTAVGAALYVYNHVLNQPRIKEIKHAYTGSKFTSQEIEEYLIKENISYKKYDNDDELFDVVTNCLINSGVVGWFQGRAEFGPRALGHRSILADPRRNDAKDILNTKIKRRESFRPFAPSILFEYKDEFFEGADEVPFMEKVYSIKKDKQSLIPAVTHVDGTGRLQTVYKGDRYYSLIDTFRKKTGVPILLNTSFNENEPIVNTPKEALDCYLRTKMDMLVLENIIVSRV
jgi:carbamoyltransferase